MKPYYQDDAVTIYHGDCRELTEVLAQPSVVVTDPPYGTGGWRRLASGAGSDPSASLIREHWDDGAVDWLGLVAPSPVLVFWPPARTRLLLEAAEAVGYVKHRTLYMRKRDPKPMVGGRTAWSVEPIWVLSRDGFILQGGDDVYEASTPRLGRDAGATGHPYEKPVDVVRWIISKTSRYSTVLDPFMGSGTALLAAKSMGRKAIGIELNEKWCEIAARRCSQEVLGLSA